MDECEADGEWVGQTDYDGFEVNRQGSVVYLIFSSLAEIAQVYELDPEDAVTIGIALAQAGQEPEEIK